MKGYTGKISGKLKTSALARNLFADEWIGKCLLVSTL
jgi:hypothetical protein